MSRGSGAATDLSRTARALEISPTVAMAQRAAARRASGKDVLDFSVGEPDQHTPAHVVAAAAAALEAAARATRRRRACPSCARPWSRLSRRLRRGVRHRRGGHHDRRQAGPLPRLPVAAGARGRDGRFPRPTGPPSPSACAWPAPRPCRCRSETEASPSPPAWCARADARSKALHREQPGEPHGRGDRARGDCARFGRLARRRELTVIYDDTYAWLQLRAREGRCASARCARCSASAWWCWARPPRPIA